MDRRYLLIPPPCISNRFTNLIIRLRAVATSCWTEWHHLLRSQLGNQATLEGRPSLDHPDSDPALATLTLIEDNRYPSALLILQYLQENTQ